MVYTRAGALELHIGQYCEAVKVSGGVQLITVQYRYTLTVPGKNEPFLRCMCELRAMEGCGVVTIFRARFRFNEGVATCR